MTITLTINEKKHVISADPSEKLLTVLRKEKLFSVKCGCQKGLCGNCMILLDDNPVPACLVPIGIVRDSKIVTLEYFKNDPCYQDIITGFNQAGIHLCGYCNTGKIFTAYGILKASFRPDKASLYSALRGLAPCCADSDSLAAAIMYAVAAKHTREGRHNAKK